MVLAIASLLLRVSGATACYVHAMTYDFDQDYKSNDVVAKLNKIAVHSDSFIVHAFSLSSTYRSYFLSWPLCRDSCEGEGYWKTGSIASGRANVV